MDLLYSEFCFRRYFNFIGKRRAFALVDMMQDKAEKLLQVLGSLKANTNEIQISCCISELAETLSEVSTEEIQLLEDRQSYLIVRQVMEDNFNNRDIQYHGIFALFRLMEGSLDIRRNLIDLGIHTFVIKLMKYYENEVVIQQIACRILHMLLEDANVREDLDDESTVQVIVQAMRNNVEDDELQLPALQALTKLMQEDILSENCKENFVEKNYHLLVIDVMEEHLESGIVSS